jgi:hypothetical protein
MTDRSDHLGHAQSEYPTLSSVDFGSARYFGVRHL